MQDKNTFASAAAKVVKHYGTHLAVAKVLGYSDLRNVSAWVNGLRPFPPEHCVTIERDTNGLIARRELRPDDWARYWPELATKTFTRSNGEVVTDQRKG